jgi:hypothetical protein
MIGDLGFQKIGVNQRKQKKLNEDEEFKEFSAKPMRISNAKQL